MDRLTIRAGEDEPAVVTNAASQPLLALPAAPGWGAELDTDRKFWWADWRRLIGDVITAVRSGEAVVYEDDGPERLSHPDASPTR